MFKHYLLALAIAAGLGLGCKTGKNKKPGENYALINIYLEQNNDGTKFSKRVSVYRADPDIFYVNSKPFLDTADLERVSLMSVIGGFALQFQFNDMALQCSKVIQLHPRANGWRSFVSSPTHGYWQP